MPLVITSRRAGEGFFVEAAAKKGNAADRAAFPFSCCIVVGFRAGYAAFGKAQSLRLSKRGRPSRPGRMRGAKDTELQGRELTRPSGCRKRNFDTL